LVAGVTSNIEAVSEVARFTPVPGLTEAASRPPSELFEVHTSCIFCQCLQPRPFESYMSWYVFKKITRLFGDSSLL